MPPSLYPYFDIAFRSSCVYLFMIAAFRLFGKRELSQLSIADLALIVLISNAVQNAMVGPNTSLLGGLTAATVLFCLNMLLGYLLYRFKGVRSLVQAEPVTLITDGKMVVSHMKKALLTEDELMAAIREHGLNSISEVKFAILEADGNISIISGEDHKLVRTQYKRKRKHRTIQDM
jgi:uncharacterized membrane protein YcaP (DUF421 family)